MYQKIIVVGNLGRDPEMRYMPDGTAVTNFSIATSRKWTGNDGEKREETVWFRVEVWRKQAETVNQYLGKGSKVLVEGRIKPDPATGSPRIWTRQDGTSGASFEIVADTVRFLSSLGDDADDSGAISIQSTQNAVQEEDDIPF